MKGIARRIFSRETRFPGFGGEWERKKLGEVMSVPEKTKAADVDKNKLLTVKLHLKGVCKNESTETLSLGATCYFVRKKGQFIYGKQNLFNGAFDVIPDEFDGFLSSGDVPALDIDRSKINARYLLAFLGRKIFYRQLEKMATGTGSKRIHETLLLTLKIDLPAIEEQEKIAQFLSTIGEKIQVEKDLLEKYKAQKQFLLQNLFI